MLPLVRVHCAVRAQRSAHSGQISTPNLPSTFLTALILSGVFLPTFSRQILDAVLASALLMVAVIWLVEYLAWRRPRDPDVIARREAREQLRLARLQAGLAPASVGATAGAPTTPLAPSDSNQQAGQGQESTGDSQSGSTDGKGGKQDE